MKKSKDDLLHEAKATAVAAREIIQKAEDQKRNMTADERGAYELLLAQATAKTQVLTEIKAAEDQDKAAMARLKDLADNIVDVPDYYIGPSGTPSAVKSSPWAGAVIGRMSRTAAGMGLKALLQGTIEVPAAVTIEALPATPHRLLDLIPKEPLADHSFSFLQQTVKTNNAAVVADAGTKPTSIYTFAEVEDTAKVIAHLSEPFPARYLDDFREMGRILDEQMRDGVLGALELEVVRGSGEGEHFAGLLTAAGTTGVAFATDLITTCRSARTALEVIGEAPTGWVFNPNDLQTIDLLRELLTDEGGFLIDSASAATIFGPGPRISSLAVPVGTAILADWRQASIMVREGAATLAATQATINGVNLWETNQVCLRSEGRFGLKVRRPQAFAIVELTESS